jgi:hypothetical protein
MKQLLFFSILSLMLISCSGVKKTRQAVNNGNQQWAIYQAIEKISKDKTHKRNQPYILLLEEAFQKNMQTELARIDFLEKEAHPENLRSRYNSLNDLKRIQERVAPLLPLQISAEQRMAFFEFLDYDQRILDTKEQLVDYNYNQGVAMFTQASTKAEYRTAWELLNETEALHPDFKDTREMMSLARERGIYNVLLTAQNLTGMELPEMLEAELLDVSKTNNRNTWAQYYRYPNRQISYDYEVVLALDQILISPDRLHENQKTFEKVISEGKKVVVNRKGEVIRDSLGNPVETEQLKKVKSNFKLITQEKSGMLSGTIAVIDMQTGETMDIKKVRGDSYFRHQYAVQRGDARALEKWQRRMLRRGPQPFPSPMEIIRLAGDEIRSDLHSILRQNPFE